MEQNEYLQNVAVECMEVLDRLSIPYKKPVDFTINYRAKRWGQCKRLPDGFHVNINHRLVDGQHEDGLRQTLFHELLHTCSECFNHGERWKRHAKTVELATGYVIKRCNSAEEKGLTPVDEVEGARYIFRCVSCGTLVTRQKRCRLVDKTYLFKCGRCGGRIERIK